MKAVLTIAGSDSGGGAGIQADLKTFAAHGVYGVSTVTAITAQNTLGVTAIHAVPADVVVAQIETVVSDITVAAVKTGMLLNAGIVEAVADTITALDIPLLVVDPVMMAKHGDRLLQDDAVAVVKTELLKHAYLVTPNRMEAEILSGISIASLDDARHAARRIHDLGPAAVIVKGGHLATAADEVIDLLYDGSDFIEYVGPRVRSTNTHGTGCTFGAAVTAALAVGQPLVDATRSAKTYVEHAIRHGPAIGHGHRPLEHFWNKCR